MTLVRMTGPRKNARRNVIIRLSARRAKLVKRNVRTLARCVRMEELPAAR